MTASFVARHTYQHSTMTISTKTHFHTHTHTHTQDPFLEGRDLTTYIGTMSTKPGTAGPSNSFSKWQKGGVSEYFRLGIQKMIYLT